MIRKTFLKAIEFMKVRTYASNLSSILINDGCSILDVGAGSFVLRRIYSSKKIEYIAFEPSYRKAHEAFLKAGDTVYQSYFDPTELEDHKFDYIFMLTVLDEIENKEKILDELKVHMHQDANLIIAVRNADFPMRLSSKVLERSENRMIADLEFDSWIKLFEDFDIIKCEKFSRPILSENFSVIIKQIILAIVEKFIPLEKSYMILFWLRINR